MTSIEVVAPGALTTIQDLGRPGWAHIGVPRSGAADRESLKLANQLVGNGPPRRRWRRRWSGPRLRFDGAAVVALTGAPVEAHAGERQLPMNEAIELVAGDELKVGTAKRGLRTYVAVAGGIDVPLVLGSAATDVLTGLGPPTLKRGDAIHVGGTRASGQPARPPWRRPPPPRRPQYSTYPIQSCCNASSVREVTGSPASPSTVY